MSAVPISDSNPTVEKVFRRCSEVAALPHVVYKIMEITGNDEASTTDIEKALSVDPGLSTRVLTLANSAYYNLPRRVTTIREAVMFVGFKGLREMSMSVGVYNMFIGKNDKDSLRRRSWWRHSIDTAVCCAWLARRFGGLPEDQAYTCGLLHYIGKSLLERYSPEEYNQVSRLEELGKTDRQAEKIVFGCDHTEVGTGITQRWGLPEVLIAGLQYADEPQELSPYGRLAACTAIGHHVSKLVVAGCKVGDADPRDLVPGWAMQWIGMDEGQLAEVFDGCGQAIAQASSLAA